jgi:hypothetical protein
MKDRVASAIFSLSGLSFAIGAIGFLSALVQLFINTDRQLSVRWLLFAAWVFLTLTAVLLKIIYDLSNERRPPANFEVPIKFLPKDGIFLIRRNENFRNSIVVGCYILKDNVDSLLGVGYVHIVQDDFIQIKLHEPLPDGHELDLSSDSLRQVMIRPVVPIAAFRQLNPMGTSNE